jgi:uncharacterized phiE125 gp8 family phage protein
VNRSAPRLVTAPTARLVALDEVKAQCRASHVDDEDSYFSALGLVAESHLDGWSGVLRRALLTQTWRDVWDDFPREVCLDHRDRLSLGPVQSVTSVRYYAAGATSLSTVDPAKYRLTHHHAGAFLELVENADWPDNLAARSDAVQIDYVAGYGDIASSVPPAIRHAALLLIAHLYENREATVAGQVQVTTVPLAFEALLAPFRGAVG